MKNLTWISLLGVTVLLAACDATGVRGNGHIVTRSREVTPFINIEVRGAFTIDWRKGPPSMSVTTDENLMPLIEASVNDGTLLVKTSRNTRPSDSVKLILTSPARESADLSGASRFTATQLSGALFSIKTSGASQVTIDGAVDELVATMTGGSKLRADDLRTKTAALDLTGAGNARVNVSDTLKVSIAGAGRVDYAGNPPHIERRIAGVGSIKKIE